MFIYKRVRERLPSDIKSDLARIMAGLSILVSLLRTLIFCPPNDSYSRLKVNFAVFIFLNEFSRFFKNFYKLKLQEFLGKSLNYVMAFEDLFRGSKKRRKSENNNLNE